MNKIFFWKPIPKVEGIVDESCLGQWYPSPFKVNDIEYACAEQFMMASKAELFKDSETREKIMHCTNPFEMKKLGREIKNFNSEVWDSHKEKIVFAGNMNKFSQNLDLKSYLLQKMQNYMKPVLMIKFGELVYLKKKQLIERNLIQD